MSASRSASPVNGPTSDDDPRAAIYDPHATNWDDDDEEDDDMDYVPAPEDSEEDDEDGGGNFYGMLLIKHYCSMANRFSKMPRKT